MPPLNYGLIASRAASAYGQEDTEPQGASVRIRQGIQQRRDSLLSGKEYKRQRAQQQLQRPSARLQPTGLQQPVATSAADPNLASEFDERSLLRQTGDVALDTVGGLGNILDVPGSVVRDVLTWLPGGPTPHNPLDQLLPWNWGSSDVRISGEELLEGYGLLDDSGDPKGLGTTLGRMGAGIGLEVLLDPLTYMSFGASAAVKGVGKGAQAARSLKKIGLLDNIDIYAKNAGKVSDAVGDIGKRESLLKMSAKDAIQNPVKQSGKTTGKATDSLSKEFENALAGDKHFKKAAEAKGVKRGSKEWDEMVGEVANADISQGYMRFRLPGGIVDKSFGSGLAPGVDRLARGMRYSRPIIGVTSRMSKTFQHANTPESQKAIREAKNLLQQDFVVAKQEMFESIKQLDPILNNFNKYDEAGEIIEEVSGEVLQQKRNEIGNFMLEYLEDIGRVRKSDEQLIAEGLMDEDSGMLEFMLSRDELFTESSSGYAERFLKEKIKAFSDSSDKAIAGQADEIGARLRAAIDPLDRTKTQMDDLVVEASDMNVDVTQLQDLYASYFPRIRQTIKGTVTGKKSGGSKLFDPETPHKIKREDRYRNIVGGTAALNRMSTDTEFAGTLSPTLWNKTKELAEKKGESWDNFTKKYSNEMSGLTDEAKKDLFKAITERTIEDVQKNITMFSVNPADAALRALEAAYKARSNADVLRNIVADTMVVRDRSVAATEAGIRSAFGSEGADSALGTVSEAAQSVGRGTDQGMSDVVRQLDVQSGRTPRDQTGAGGERPGPGGDGSPASPKPDSPSGVPPDAPPSPPADDATKVADDATKVADDAAEAVTTEGRIQSIADSDFDALISDGGELSTAASMNALKNLADELFGNGHGIRARSKVNIATQIHEKAKVIVREAKTRKASENLDGLKFEGGGDASPMDAAELGRQFDGKSNSSDILDATGVFKGESEGVGYMIKLDGEAKLSAMKSIDRNPNAPNANNMIAAEELINDATDTLNSSARQAVGPAYDASGGIRYARYSDSSGNRVIVSGRVIDTIVDMHPDAVVKVTTRAGTPSGLVFLDESGELLAQVSAISKQTNVAIEAAAHRSALSRPSTTKLDDAIVELGPKARRATGLLKFTNPEMTAISHRLDTPDAISESLHDAMNDGEEELLERLGYSQTPSEDELKGRVIEVVDLLKAGKFDDAMKADGELAAEILDQAVDETTNTYLDMARGATGDDLNPKQFNTLKRAFLRAKAKVDKYLVVPPKAVNSLDPKASARDRVYSQMIEVVGEEQAAANIALSDAFANQIVKSGNDVGSVDEYYERYLTQVRRMEEYVKGREDTLQQAELIKGQPVSSLVRTETDPLVLAQSRHAVFRSQYDVWILTRDESLKPGATSGEKHNLAFKAWMKSDLSAGDFQAVGDGRNSEWISQTGIPSNDRIRQILSSDKRDTVVDISQFDGQTVGVRIDIPAFESSGEYVVTLHEGERGGKVIAHTGYARIEGEVDLKLTVGQQKESNRIAKGEKNKTTLARAFGELSAPQGAENVIPVDIDSWTPLGFNPKKANFFYDKRTGQEVRRGNDVIAVGNTLFMREVTEYGTTRNAIKSHGTRFDILKQSAFHGNGIPPFDKFTLSKIGTGEGAQAFGYGLYFASSKGVANYYRRTLGGWSYQGQKVGRTLDAGLDDYVDMSIGEARERYYPGLENLSVTKAQVIKTRNADPQYLIAQVLENFLHGTINDDLASVERSIRYKSNKYNTELSKFWRSDRVLHRSPGDLDMDVLTEADVYPVEDIIATMYRMEADGVITSHKGSLYEVDLLPKDSEYLMWDESAFGSSVSPVVRNGLDDILENEWHPLIADRVEELRLNPLDEAGNLSKRQQALSALDLDESASAGDVLKALESAFTPQQVSEMLNARGIKGVKFLDGLSRKGKKNANYNFVIFDDASVHITNVLEQRKTAGTGPPRGMIQLGEEGRDAVITLLKGSDASTLPHELSHAFRRQLHLLDDDLLLRSEKHYGVNNGAWTRENEEAWAGDFEKYLATGEAPTKDLESVFARMKTWMLDIYKGVKGSPLERELSPEMRDVFDNMLGKKRPKRKQAPTLKKKRAGLIDAAGGADRPYRVSKKVHLKRRKILADYYDIHPNKITPDKREAMEAMLEDARADMASENLELNLLRDAFWRAPGTERIGEGISIDDHLIYLHEHASQHEQTGGRSGRGGDSDNWKYSDDAGWSPLLDEHSSIINHLGGSGGGGGGDYTEAVFKAILKLDVKTKHTTVVRKATSTKPETTHIRKTKYIAAGKSDLWKSEDGISRADEYITNTQPVGVKDSVFGEKKTSDPTDFAFGANGEEMFQPGILRQEAKPEMFASGKYFSQQAFDRAETGYKSRRTIVEMNIQDFLRMAERLDQARPTSQDAVRTVVEDGEKFSDLPYLSFSNDGKGTASVVGHEGRHRAMELAAQGETKMPVVFESAGGQEIRWSEQGDARGFDRVRGAWPKNLVTQNRGSGDAVPFPVEDPLATSATAVSKSSDASDLFQPVVRRTEKYATEGTYEVTLPNGEKHEIFRDTQQFGTPVWHLVGDDRKGGMAAVGIGDTKQEAIDYLMRTYGKGSAKITAPGSVVESQPGIQPAAPLSNAAARKGDQLGLLDGTGQRRQFRSKIKDTHKAKQSSLFETSNAKVDRDQMDMFGDDATPEDLVYKPDADPKPSDDPEPGMLFQSATSGIRRNVKNAEGEVVAQVEMPSSEWATASKKTIVRAMDGAKPQDMVRVMSGLVVDELDRVDPALSAHAQAIYGAFNNNWDLPVTKGGVTRSAREWMAEDMVRYSEGKIKPPVGMHKYMAGFKQHLSKVMGKRGAALADDVKVGQLFNKLLKPEPSAMVPFYSESGESVLGAMGVKLSPLRETTKKLNHRQERARAAMIALLPPEAAETARQNILRERHSKVRRTWLENRDSWQAEIDELKGRLEDLAGSDNTEAISDLKRSGKALEKKLKDIPEKDYDEWYSNALKSDKRNYNGVNLDVDPKMWLGQVKLPRRIADDLVSVSKATTYLTDDFSVGPLLGWFDSYNKLFKTNVTSTNPGFHVRNFFSGFIQNALNDVTDPRFGAMDIRRYTTPYGDSQSLMKGNTIEDAGSIPLFLKLKPAKGQTLDEAATEEIAELLFAHDIVNAPGTHRDLPGEAPASIQSQLIGPSFGHHDKIIFGRNSFALNRSRTSPVAKRVKDSMTVSEKATVRVRDTYKKYLEIAQNVGDSVEIQHRAGGFIALLRQGYSPDEAARIVKLIQVDYSNLSNFEKEYMRRFFPFYSFSRGMAVYLGKELSTNPAGKVGIAIRAQRHGRDRDVATPTYINKGLSLPVGVNADGTRHYLTNIGMMHEQPVQQAAGFAALNAGDAAFSIIGNMNPLLKLPLELAFDESSFQQSVSGGVDLDDADPSLGRAISNVAQGLGLRDKDRKQPIRLGKLTEVLAGSSPASRYINTVRTAFDPRKNYLQRAANTLTGLRVTSVSPDRQDAVLRERAEMYLQGEGARQFQKSYIPDEIKNNMSEEELKAVQQYEQLIEILAKRSKERRKNKEKE